MNRDDVGGVIMKLQEFLMKRLAGGDGIESLFTAENGRRQDRSCFVGFGFGKKTVEQVQPLIDLMDKWSKSPDLDTQWRVMAALKAAWTTLMDSVTNELLKAQSKGDDTTVNLAMSSKDWGAFAFLAAYFECAGDWKKMGPALVDNHVKYNSKDE